MALENILKNLRIVAVLAIFSATVYCATTGVSAKFRKLIQVTIKFSLKLYSSHFLC